MSLADAFRANPKQALTDAFLHELQLRDPQLLERVLELARQHGLVPDYSGESAIQKQGRRLSIAIRKNVAVPFLRMKTDFNTSVAIMVGGEALKNEVLALDHVYKLEQLSRMQEAEVARRELSDDKPLVSILEGSKGFPDFLKKLKGAFNPFFAITPHPTSQQDETGEEITVQMHQTLSEFRAGTISDAEFDKHMQGLIEDFLGAQAIRSEKRTVADEAETGLLGTDDGMNGAIEDMRDRFRTVKAFYAQEGQTELNRSDKIKTLRQLAAQYPAYKTWTNKFDSDGNPGDIAEQQRYGIVDLRQYVLERLHYYSDFYGGDENNENSQLPPEFEKRFKSFVLESLREMPADEDIEFAVPPIPIDGIRELLEEGYAECEAMGEGGDDVDVMLENIAALEGVLNGLTVSGQAQKRENSAVYGQVVTALLREAGYGHVAYADDGEGKETFIAAMTDILQNPVKRAAFCNAGLELWNQKEVLLKSEDPDEKKKWQVIFDEMESQMLVLANPQQVQSIVVADGRNAANLLSVHGGLDVAAHILKEKYDVNNANPASARVQLLVEREDHIRDFGKELHLISKNPVCLKHIIDNSLYHYPGGELVLQIPMNARSDTSRAGSTDASICALLDLIGELRQKRFTNKIKEDIIALLRQPEFANNTDYQKLLANIENGVTQVRVELCLGKAMFSLARGGQEEPAKDIQKILAYTDINNELDTAEAEEFMQEVKLRMLIQGIDAPISAPYFDLVLNQIRLEQMRLRDPKNRAEAIEKSNIHFELVNSGFFDQSADDAAKDYKKMVFNEDIANTENPNAFLSEMLKRYGFDLQTILNVGSRPNTKGGAGDKIDPKKSRAIAFEHTLILSGGRFTYATGGSNWARSMEWLYAQVQANEKGAFATLREKMGDENLTSQAAFEKKLMELSPGMRRRAHEMAINAATLDVEFSWQQMFGRHDKMPDVPGLEALAKGDDHKASMAKIMLEVHKTATETYRALHGKEMPQQQTVAGACKWLLNDVYPEFVPAQQQYERNIRDFWGVLRELGYPEVKLSEMTADQQKLIRARGALVYGQGFNLPKEHMLEGLNDNQAKQMMSLQTAQAER
jgi:hypothetical protein